MKKRIVLLPLLALFAYVIFAGNSSGPGSISGVDATTGGCSCHNAAATTSTTVLVELLSGGSPVTSYTPGSSYTIRLTGTQTSSSLSLPRFGFQLRAVTSGGGNAGTVTAPTGTHTVSVSGATMVEHNSAMMPTSGTGGAGTTYVVNVPWTAPAAGTGSVTLRGVVNAVNFNATVDAGDKWNNASTVISEASAASAPVITAVSPLIGNPGSSVTITGSNFNTTAANNIVYFGATRATVASATGTALTVNVPTGATFAPVSVLNTASSLTGYAQYPFLPKYDNSAYTQNVVQFNNKVDFAGSDGVYGVAIADLNSDGKSDIVSVNYASNTISVFRNTSISGVISSSSFATKVDYSVGINPRFVAIADYDGDGKLDLAVANTGATTVSVLRNTSSGGAFTSSSFAAKVDFNVGGNPYGIAAGDINGDGKSDLIVTRSSSAVVAVLQNVTTPGSISSTSFSSPVSFSTATSPTSVAASDIDGDNKPDVIVTNSSSGSISILRNTSSGITISSASLASKVDFATVNNPNHLAIADLDGDSKPDITVTTDFATVAAFSVLRNTSSIGTISSGSFAAKVDFSVAGWSGGVNIGDFDGDAKPDLAIVDLTADYIRVYRNTATSGVISTSSFASNIHLPISTAPSELAIGDLDGDGKADIIAGNASTGSSHVSVIRNNQLLAPPTVTSLSVSSGVPGTAVTITGTKFNTTTANNIVYFGASKATVSAATASSLSVVVPNGATLQHVSVNNTELGLYGFSQYPFVPKFNGSPYLSSINFNSRVDFTTGTSPCYIAAGDLDNDGKTDVVVANYGTNTVSVFKNIATTGVFSTSSFAAKFDLTAGSGPQGIAVADMDGDGKLDIIVGYPSTTGIGFSVFRNVSTVGALTSSSFASRVDFNTGSGGQNVVVMADMDRDGKHDLLSSMSSANNVSVHRNISSAGTLGSSHLQTSSTFSSSQPFGMAVGDIDGDGRPDIVSAGNGANKVHIFRNNSIVGYITSSSFDTRVDFTTGSSPYNVAIGDLDGDGKQEIVVNNYGSNTISVFKNVATPGNITTSSLESKVDFATGTLPQSLALGDLNGDDKLDIVVTNRSSSTVSVFRNTTTSGTISTSSFAAKVDFASATNPWGIAIADIDGDAKSDLLVANNGAGGISVFRNNPLSPIGGAASLCIGGTTTLTDSASGGTWTTSDATVATVGTASGIVTGIGAGTATITYTVAGGSTTTVVTVSAPPASITGTAVVCAGSATTLGNATSGGTWATSNPTIAVVGSSTGIVTGVATGTTHITYSIGSCISTTVVTVNAGVPSITGTATVCAGGTTTLANSVTGGSWVSSATGIATVNTTTGVVTGIAAGTVGISYTLSTGCFAMRIVTVNAAPAAISGTLTTAVGATSTLSNTTTGGTWSSGNMVIVTLGSASGVATGISAGTTTITYTLVTGCRATAIFTVTTASSSAPIITSISPASAAPGSTLTMTGSNFNTTAANNIVYFGATRATVTSASSTSLTVTVPYGAMYGPVSVTNAVSALTGYSARPFVPTFSPGSYAPAFLYGTHIDVQIPSAAIDATKAVVGDIDGDGQPDIVMASQNYYQLAIFRNTGTAMGPNKFASPPAFTLPSVAKDVSLADVDGDGKLDVIAAYGNFVSVFRNVASTGSITTSSLASRVDFNAGAGVIGIAVADLDMDGKPELLAGVNSGIKVFKNISTSGSITSSSFATPATIGTNGGKLAIADIDGDGKPEVISRLNSFASWFAVFRNTSSVGAVSFSSAVTFGTSGNITSLTVGDIDGDTKPDVITTESSTSLGIYRNTASSGAITTGSFASIVTFTTPTNYGNLTLSDVNGDSKLDVLLATWIGSVGPHISVLPNTATSGAVTSGSLGTRVDILNVPNIPIIDGANYYDFTLADMDNDGRPEIVTVASGNSLSIIKNQVPPPTISSMSAATGAPGSSLSITGNNFAPTTTANIVYFGGVRAAVTAASITSLTVTVPVGATHSRVSVTNTNTSLTAYSPQPFRPSYDNSAYASGSINFNSRVDYTVSADVEAAKIAFGDLDGDGKPDMVAVTPSSDGVSVYRNTSSAGTITAGSFATPVIFSMGDEIKDVAVADIDGDGKQDLLVAAQVGFWVRRNTTSSTGAFSAGSFASAVSFEVEHGNEGLQVADIDKDGKPEVILYSKYLDVFNGMSVYHNVSVSGTINSNSFNSPQFFTSYSGSMQDMTTGDFNLDGRLDLASNIGGTSTPFFLVHVSNSIPGIIHGTAGSPYGAASASWGATFADSTVSTVFSYSGRVASGDIDGDGKEDVVVLNITPHTLSVYRNISTGSALAFATRVNFTISSSADSHEMALGDVDGDGKLDIVVSNMGTADSNILVYRNTSSSGSITSGSFASPMVFAGKSYNGAIKVADIDGDHKGDIIVCNSYNNVVSILRNSPLAATSASYTMCTGATLTLIDTAAGTWSSSNISVATVGSATGIVSGLSSGTVIITHTRTAGGLSTTTITVNPVPAAITGTLLLCDGNTVTLSSATSGGTWTTGSAVVATIGSASGVVTGITTGTANISYTLGTGCLATAVVTVNAPVPSIGGTATVCVGGTTTLTNTASSGVWQSSLLAVAVVGSSTGIVTGMGAGTAIISYSLSAGCRSIRIVTVNGNPAAITGATTVAVGESTSLANATAGGTWSSGATGIATINSSGVVTGISPGTAQITYALPTGCRAFAIVTVTGTSGIPYISSLSALAAVPGSTVTITGGNFSSTPASNIVTFGGMRAAVTAASPTSLQVTTPAGAVYGPVAVNNAAVNLSAISANFFLPTYNNAPYVSSIINFKPRVDYIAGGGANGIASGDLDGDGKPDLVTADWSGTISVYRNTSAGGSFTATSFADKVSIASDISTIQIAIADLDRDGKQDIVASNYYGNTLSIFRNVHTTGSITSSSFASRVDISAGGLSPYDVAIGDVDGDGKLDIVAPNYDSSTISVYRNVSTPGSITASSFARVNLPAAAGPFYVALGDLDSDGKPELSVSNYGSGSVSVYKNLSTSGTITTSSFATPVAFSAGSQPAGIKLGDIDGDGKLDIVYAATGDTAIAVLRNTTASGVINSSSFAAKVNFAAGLEPSDLTLGDFNGDSKVDVVVTNASSNSVSVYRNTAAAGTINASSFAAKKDFGQGTYLYPYEAAVADFNNDSKPDIAFCNYISSTLSVLANDPLSPLAGNSICVSGTLSLADSASGGTWTSSDTSIATVGSSTGVVTAIAPGIATITYTVAGGSVFSTITVNPAPTVAAITGSDSVCASSAITLANATSGGSWSSSNSSIATVNSAGVVNGIGAGTVTVSYTLAGTCGTATATKLITVKALPVAGTITGASTVCAGSAISLSSTVTGGSWTSSMPSIASVNSSGIVTGSIAGTAVVSYAAGNSCGTATTTKTVTVNPLPNAGAITGASTVCVGFTASLSSTAGGGSWTSSAIPIIIVNGAGVVTGVAEGTGTISYTVSNSCGTAIAVKAMTVNPLPNAGAISGSSVVCAGATLSLTNTVSGGSWSSGMPSVATVNSSGVVTGNIAGTAIISYTVGNSCSTAVATKSITVNPLPTPGIITGSSVVCGGASISLSNTSTGGSWTSSHPAVASVGSTGVVAGISAGSAIISYTVSNGCGTASATKTVNVNPAPYVDSISGPSAVCVSSAISLSNSASGGSWSISLPSVASVNSAGVVTGATAGTAVISYTFSNSCGVAVATRLVTVYPLPGAGTISGASTVCQGSTITLSNAVTGGTWSGSSDTTASVSAAGVVSGLSAGVVTISYSVANSCGIAAATKAVTVLALPDAGEIAGPAVVAVGSTISLASTGTGGTWVSGNSNATVSTTGVVTGVSAGTVMISYSVVNACGIDYAMTLITVNPVTAPITGSRTVCVGQVSTLGNAVAGGTWFSSNTSVATVDTGGRVMGMSPGTSVVSYTTVAGTVTAVITVNANPSSIAGSSSLCVGSATVLSSATTGGTWSSSNSTIATVSTTGAVTGYAVGTATISYSVAGCSATRPVTVNTVPAAISGGMAVCAGSTTLLTSTSAGGSWTSSNAAIATVDSSGTVSGVATGTAIITYTLSGCRVTAIVTVTAAPSAGTISGPSSVSVGSTITLASTATGGTWSTSDSAVTVSASGVVTGVAAGTGTVSYLRTGTCGTSVAIKVVTVTAAPITGPMLSCTGVTITLTNATTGGTWSSSNVAIATIGETSGALTGIAAGTAVISYLSVHGYVTAVVTINNTPAALTGTPTLCAGNATALTTTTTGGTWISSATSVATVNTTGLVTGVASGVSNISYVKAGCAAVQAVTVNANPSAISGSTSSCVAGTATLSSSPSGGSWSSSTGTVATVSSAGVVTGVAAGTTTITYTLGTGCRAVRTTSVIAAPAATVISGPSTVGVGSSIALSSTLTGGAWSVSTGNATITSAGIVTGVAAGSTTVSYVRSNVCGSAVTTYAITVTAAPITGTATVCVGSSVSLSHVISGGSWSSTNPTVATVGTGTGVVAGISAGTAEISYIYGSGIATRIVTVNAAPSVGAISGTATICTGTTATLSNTSAGGLWVSSTVSVASIGSATGVVSGIAAGTSRITYTVSNSCGTANAVTTVTVSASPFAGTISGTAILCAGGVTTLSSTGSGGTWSSSNTAVATIDPAINIVNGVAAGTATISYTVTNSCGTARATRIVTVNGVPSPGTIIGTATVCLGATRTLTATVAGGTWSSADPSLATVSGSGVVSGIAGGTVVISYAVSGTCGTSVATRVVTVNATAAVGDITGVLTVCTSGTTTLANTTTGGAWSSGNTSIATVNASSGVVSGVAPGTAVISYSASGSCGSAVATAVVTVNAVTTGTISGTTVLCAGTTVTLDHSIGGGTWSSNNSAIATIGSATGIVSGVVGGTARITYTTVGSCGTVYSTAVVTVNGLPGTGTISGATAVCIGSSATVSSTISGGVWSSSNPSVATVGASSGVVAGISGGVILISYATTNGCGTSYATRSVTVNTAPGVGSISGAASLCAGETAAYTNSISGGSWASSNAAVLTINSGGVATAVGAGVATITYSISGSCGTANAVTSVTVNASPNAGTISGPTAACVGSSIGLTASGSSGGAWSSGNTAVATVNAATGEVAAIAAGSVVISYSVTNSCGTDVATKVLSVSDVPGAVTITGDANICPAGTTTLSSSATGGTWSSSNTAVAAVSAAGIVTAISTGTATMSYTVSNTCGTTLGMLTVTVSATPSAGSITGTAVACAGSVSTLANSVSGGVWSSSNTAVATVTATGVVSALTAGTSIISYTVTTACGTATATTVFTVNPLPDAGTISGASTVSIGEEITLSASVTGGTWSAGNTNASVTGLGVVSGVSLGSVIISYTVSNSCGTAVATKNVTVGFTMEPITGSLSVCTGATTNLANATSGGTWSSGAPAKATVSATGVVTGVSAGTAVISYTLYSVSATAVVTVFSTPGAIAGTAVVCSGSTTTLANSTSGGTWSSNDPGIAATATTGGVITGVSGGEATITYMLSSGCYATRVVTVNGGPSAITGSTMQCAGTTTTLSNGVSGGTWSSSSAVVATIGSASGVLSAVAPGIAGITYTLPSGCRATTSVTVTSLPGVISGTLHVCEGTMTALSNATAGGTWSTSDASIAQVVAPGFISGVSAGTALVSYTTGAGCVRTAVITVNATPDAITGTTEVCIGLTTTLANTTVGGTWTYSAGGALPMTLSSSGVITGMSAGTGTVTYTVGSCRAYTVVTVHALPTAVTGPSKVCPDENITLASTTAGGTWSSSDLFIASVAAGGVVTGHVPGTVTITYTVATGCYRTKLVTVNPAPAAITGVGTACPGTTTTLANTYTAGALGWFSADLSVAKVNQTYGIVLGMTAGTAVISYRLGNGCSATTVVTIHPLPAAITGSLAVCQGATASLASATAGGTWSSSNVAKATVDMTSGVVSGIATGNATITYTAATGCIQKAIVTVNGLPSAISGYPIACVGTTTSLSSAYGGTWSSSDVSVASVGTSTGAVTGASAGTVTITYRYTATGCYVTREVTVNPALPAVTGTFSVCPGLTTTLSNAVTGGTWSTANVAVALVGSATGIVTGVGTGTINITYAFGSGCRILTPVTVKTLPAAISGPVTMCNSMTANLTNVTPGGTWSSSNTAVATVGLMNGVVSGIAGGTVHITYTSPNACYVTRIMTVVACTRPGEAAPAAAPAVVKAYPNPTSGIFTLEADTEGVLYLFTADGKALKSYLVPKGGAVVELPADLANGVYICRFSGSDGSTAMIRLVFER